ncbi:MAG: RNA polymerase sigma factor [Phycisphaerales bacterium]|nr:RNA polymerase sigma factor [Phycisphaerales bacterium]MCB9841481.1 RNA polymerase sigma factor [Phycisphaeraceae bacterium]
MATDRDLLVSIARGSDAAARELWARHAGRLRAFLLALAPGGPVDADDVVQQTFCRILETSVARLRDVEDGAAWLFQVARNIAFNERRAGKRERERLGKRSRSRGAGDSAPGGAIAGSRDTYDATAHDAALHAALRSLMPDMRDVVLLKHVGGLTFEQIALATQTNRNTAASRYRAAMGLLERALRKQAAPESTTIAVAPASDRRGATPATEVSHG